MKSLAISLAVLVILWPCVSTARGPAIEWVTVGDPGNADDEHGDGYGGVDHVFQIGRHEVTNAQYCEFLNAVAADDWNTLYNIEMSRGNGGISRDGLGGSYTYSVIPGRGSMPVNFVSWYDALRFANWMHNGKPSGAQGLSTTENGAYDMSLGPNATRKPGALVFLPSEDEWYKAAYYKTGGTAAGYWDYPTQSNDPPSHEAPPGTDMANGSANVTETMAGDFNSVGAYTGKPSNSAYGTFDQGGNAFEWNEAVMGSDRVVRGSSFTSYAYYMSAAFRLNVYSSGEWWYVGFRIARMPLVDADGDGDADLRDHALLQRSFTGPQ